MFVEGGQALWRNFRHYFDQLRPNMIGLVAVGKFGYHFDDGDEPIETCPCYSRVFGAYLNNPIEYVHRAKVFSPAIADETFGSVRQKLSLSSVLIEERQLRELRPTLRSLAELCDL